MNHELIQACITGTKFAVNRSKKVTLNGHQLYVVAELVYQQGELTRMSEPSVDDQEAWQAWSESNKMLFQLYLDLSKAAREAK